MLQPIGRYDAYIHMLLNKITASNNMRASVSQIIYWLDRKVHICTVWIFTKKDNYALIVHCYNMNNTAISSTRTIAHEVNSFDSVYLLS